LGRQMARAPLFSSRFDSGNGKLVGAPRETSGGVWEVDVELEKEPFTHGTDLKAHSQWFHFRIGNVRGRTLRVSLVNAGEASYAHTWPGYKAAVSFDRKQWRRCANTQYEGGVLRWEVDAGERDTLWCAYFAPYSYERHQDLIAKCNCSPLARVVEIAHSLDGRPIEVVQFGTGERKVWVTARQHPGESMAEWLAEGFIDRLLDANDPKSRALREKATIMVVPNINPDGSVRGHLRTNACGANQNREWANSADGKYKAPSMERSPEVYAVLAAMYEIGCDAFVDVHGDEDIEANFFVGTHNLPSFSPRLSALFDNFATALERANPDFQIPLGYHWPHPDKPRKARSDRKTNLSTGNSQVAARFDCLAVTLEMPFKDSKFNTPEPDCQWSPQRSALLGHSLVDALDDVAMSLREPTHSKL